MKPVSSICLTLPYPPSANKLWRKYRGRMVKSDEARAYTVAVRIASAKQLRGPFAPLAGPVRVVMRFIRPGESGDLDNRIKALLDALQDQPVKLGGRRVGKTAGVAFHNDSQVQVIDACFLGGAEPSVEVEVHSHSTPTLARSR